MPQTALSENAQKARDLALGLMAQHSLLGWQFGFDRARRRKGSCRAPLPDAPGRITLSLHFVERNDLARVRLTVLHEIAHALVGLQHGHDEVWRAKCLEIGGDGKRCGQADMPEGRWRATCPSCRKELSRHRRPKTLTGYHCKACGPEKGRIRWAGPRKARAPRAS